VSQAGTKPPGGTRDFLPDDIRRREHVVRVVRDVYESYGFEPLETPAFENIDTLLGKYGEEGNKLIFKILKRGPDEASGGADGEGQRQVNQRQFEDGRPVRFTMASAEASEATEWQVSGTGARRRRDGWRGRQHW